MNYFATLSTDLDPRIADLFNGKRHKHQMQATTDYDTILNPVRKNQSKTAYAQGFHEPYREKTFRCHSLSSPARSESANRSVYKSNPTARPLISRALEVTGLSMCHQSDGTCSLVPHSSGLPSTKSCRGKEEVAG